jgi:hypothetical protein
MEEPSSALDKGGGIVDEWAKATLVFCIIGRQRRMKKRTYQLLRGVDET